MILVNGRLLVSCFPKTDRLSFLHRALQHCWNKNNDKNGGGVGHSLLCSLQIENNKNQENKDNDSEESVGYNDDDNNNDVDGRRQKRKCHYSIREVKEQDSQHFFISSTLSYLFVTHPVLHP